MQSQYKSSPHAFSSSLLRGFKTPCTKTKTVSRTKTMPKLPSKYAEVAQSLVNLTSPRKRQALDAKVQNSILARERYHQEMQKAFVETKLNGKKADLQTKADYCRLFISCNRGLKLADFCKLLNVSWRCLKKYLYSLTSQQRKSSLMQRYQTSSKPFKTF